jgi:lysophospholipase L1-like esterase
MTFPTRIFRAPVGVIVLLVCALPLLSGCDEGSLNAPEIQSGGENGDLFTSYVALGNSITAGFQSAGINSSTQSDSYAAILSEKMNTPFGLPLLSNPGCPPPIQSLTPSPPQTRCAFRSSSSTQVRNVAVPGAALSDILSNDDPNAPDIPPGPNQLTQFILGGRTQIDAALDASPTFATIWAGNNDILGAAQAGTVSLATDSAQFASRYKSITQRLQNEAPLKGAVLIGVADLKKVPGIFLGQAYFSFFRDNTGEFPSNFSVSSTCAPGSMVPGAKGDVNQISFLFFLNQVNEAFSKPNESFEVGCLDNDPGSLTPNEIDDLSTRSQEYNNAIETIASENEQLAFFNPNTAFTALENQGEIPTVPDTDSDQPFGRFFSLDGVHPSSLTHRVVAAQLIEIINAEYGAELSAPQLPPEVAQLLN